MVWWESRTQADLVQHGKIISTWIEFTTTLRTQFYLLAYIQTTMINSQHLRKVKEKNEQRYMQEFKKQAFSLGIPLYT